MIGIVTFRGLSLGLTTLFLCLAAWYYISRPKAKPIPSEHRLRCEKILNCRHGVTGATLSIDKSIWARALPNQRLKSAFDIDNGFTTFANDYRRQFREEAEGKLKLTDDRWKDLASLAQRLVSETLRAEANKDEILLTPLVQSLALKIVLYILFELKPLELDDTTIRELAHQINELWLESKSRPMKTGQIGSLKESLKENLGKIFPGRGLESKESPMNLILPAYETVWRVVFRCFLEVVFRNPATAPAWRHALAKFLNDPTADQFKYASKQYPVSVSFIVSEALRLYPPTKRVFRKFPEESGWGTEMFAADIEACHRDPAIWGAHSLQFVPLRWKILSPSFWNSFIPFGGSLFVCPAKKEFGSRMTGLLVAALAQGISEGGEWTLNHDENWNGPGRLPLDSDRKAYHSLSISRRTGK